MIMKILNKYVRRVSTFILLYSVGYLILDFLFRGVILHNFGVPVYFFMQLVYLVVLIVLIRSKVVELY